MDGKEEGMEEGEQQEKWCCCGKRNRNDFERELHIAVASRDGRNHGKPPDERQRLGGAWVLVDEESGIVRRAGRVRIPATGATEDYSTKTESDTIRIALLDCFQELNNCMELREITDSKSWTSLYKMIQKETVKARRLLRKPDVGWIIATGRILKMLKKMQTEFSAEWQGAEHNLEYNADERLTVKFRSNMVVDAMAGDSAKSGQETELDFFKVHCKPNKDISGEMYYTSGGAVVTGDPREWVNSVSSKLAATKSQKGEASGETIRMATSGEIQIQYTMYARSIMTNTELGTAVRGALYRLRCSTRELARMCTNSETQAIREMLKKCEKRGEECIMV